MAYYWELFGTAWLTLMIAAIPLSLLGIIVVARAQVILAVAASQSAACGAAAAMALIGFFDGVHVHGDYRIHFGALCGGLIGTAIAWTGSHERAAWLFTAAGAGTILFIEQSPYGMHDVLALQHSDVLTATNNDALFFTTVTVVLIICLLRWHRELRLLAIDPGHAQVCGMQVSRWNFVVGIFIGLIISFAVSVFGLLFAFACLILPSIICSPLIRSFGSLLWLAPLTAVLATIAGIYAGEVFDVSPGQSIAALLALLYPITILIGLCCTKLLSKKQSLDQAEKSA